MWNSMATELEVELLIECLLFQFTPYFPLTEFKSYTECRDMGDLVIIRIFLEMACLLLIKNFHIMYIYMYTCMYTLSASRLDREGLF